MGAADLLQHVRAAGIVLDAADGMLLVTPASKLTDALRDALRHAKPELLALLADRAAHARPFKLTLIQGGAAHADPWDEAAMARFEARTEHLGQQGFGEQDAEDLAERLHLRDVHADYRHLCLECRHYRPGRCGNHKCAALSSPALARDLATTLQDCAGFSSATTSEGQR